MFQATAYGDETATRMLGAYFLENEETGALSSAANELPDGSWNVELLFDEEPNAAMLAGVAETVLGHPIDFEVAPLPDLDWVAKSLEGLAPVHAGRFVVHGSHDREHVPANAIGLEIEAAQAFGTGHHATTWGCLLMIDRLFRRRTPVSMLDLGCGTGVLAIGAAKLMRRPVLATDIDPLAVRITRENAQANGVGAFVEAVTATGFGHPRFAERMPFDFVVANILARPLMALAPVMARHLAVGADVVLSGLRVEDVARVRAAYVGQGLAYVSRLERDGWATLHLRCG
ncbi:MAG: 50S ribosomal protein L11 methyltransferase [Hyphomicrobiales bacterium]|nr:MAG: 50S ribosomal protein L11 methyltransferase [Hyphomicrobiales bacterium]